MPATFLNRMPHHSPFFCLVRPTHSANSSLLGLVADRKMRPM